MSIQIECKKGEGNILGNFFRKFVLTQTPSVRPIAFRFSEEGANILHSSPDIVEDNMQFYHNLSTLNFISRYDKELIEVNYKIGSSLTSDDLSTNEIKCTSENINLLTSISGNNPTSITIYYLKSTGIRTYSDNYNYLQEKLNLSEKDNSIKVMSSIHSVINDFRYNVTESGIDSETLNIDFTHENPQEVMKDVLGYLTEMFMTINNKI